MTHWLTRLGKGLLTIGVLGTLVVAVEPRALLSSLLQAQWTWILIALALLPVNLFLEGWVWNRLLTASVGEVPVSDLCRAVLCGFSLGFWTPAQIGEYPGRALSLPKGDRWTISLTVFAQRMVDMTVGVGVGLAGLTWALWTTLLPATVPWLLTAVVGLVTTVVLLVFIGDPARTHHLVQRVFSGLPAVTKRTRVFKQLSDPDLVPVLWGSLLRYATFTGQLVCLGLAFVPQGSVGLVFLAATLTFYVKYLLPSLTLLDLGIREGSAAFFFQLTGLGAAAGVNAALLLFSINLLLPAALGLPYVLRLDIPGQDPEPVPAGSEPAVLARSETGRA